MHYHHIEHEAHITCSTRSNTWLVLPPHSTCDTYIENRTHAVSQHRTCGMPYHNMGHVWHAVSQHRTCGMPYHNMGHVWHAVSPHGTRGMPYRHMGHMWHMLTVISVVISQGIRRRCPHMWATMGAEAALCSGASVGQCAHIWAGLCPQMVYGRQRWTP